MAIQGLVSGRVQGVCFRRHVQQAAEAEGVTGYARNLPDGRVEVLLCGEHHHLARVKEAVAAGPPAAHVDSVAWEEVEDMDLRRGFEVL